MTVSGHALHCRLWLPLDPIESFIFYILACGQQRIQCHCQNSNPPPHPLPPLTVQESTPGHLDREFNMIDDNCLLWNVMATENAAPLHPLYLSQIPAEALYHLHMRKLWTPYEMQWHIQFFILNDLNTLLTCCDSLAHFGGCGESGAWFKGGKKSTVCIDEHRKYIKKGI